MTKFISRAKAKPQAKSLARNASGLSSCCVRQLSQGHACSEFAITLKPLAGEGLMELFTRLSHTLREFDATILNVLVFGSVEACVAGTEAMRRALGKIDWPLTWVEGAGCSEHPIAGIHVF